MTEAQWTRAIMADRQPHWARGRLLVHAVPERYWTQLTLLRHYRLMTADEGSASAGELWVVYGRPGAFMYEHGLALLTGQRLLDFNVGGVPPGATEADAPALLLVIDSAGDFAPQASKGAILR